MRHTELENLAKFLRAARPFPNAVHAGGVALCESVTFRSTAFNTSTPEKHFVSRRAYGGDLANWLIYELARHDAAVEPMIGQKDAGWIVRFSFRGATYDFLAQYRGPDWVGLLERRRGIVGRVFRGRQKNVEFDAVRLIDAVLSSSELIFDVRWHYDESGSLL